MKIKIENFGPIHSFEMDLDKDMHILYGENNVGKSYAISMVFLILRQFEDIGVGTLENELQYHFRKVAQLSIEANSEPPHDFLQSELDEIFNRRFLPRLNNACLNSFGESAIWGNRFTKSIPCVTLVFPDFSIVMPADKAGKFSLGQVMLHFSHEFLIRVAQEQVGGKEAEMLHNSHPSAASIPFGISVDLLYEFLNQLHNNSFFLPAHRSGLYASMVSLSTVFAKLAQVRHLIPGERIDLPGLSDPASDFYLKMVTIPSEGVQTRFAEISAAMEREILKGEILFDYSRKRLMYRNASTGITIDLEFASSMVVELGILVAFLKYILSDPEANLGLSDSDGRNRIYFFIEEPETHLHPDVQIKLTEYLAQISKLGVKIVITTHSNYMFNKASNLILKGELEEAKFANYHMIMTDKGSILNPKDTLHDWGMEDENFVEAIEGLMDERIKAIEDYNNNVAS
jgi:AAA ATPase domain